MMRNWIVFGLLFSTLCRASVSYRVTDNAEACREVRFPKWTRPPNADRAWPVGTWGCQYDVRLAGPQSIYVGLSCGSTMYWRMKQKYAVDLSRSGAVREIDESRWDTGTVLEPQWIGQQYLDFQPGGVRYHGQLYPKSGANWDRHAAGFPLFSPGQSRIAVYSYDGVIKRPDEYCILFCRDDYHGKYWTEIYDIVSARRLIQITGDFSRVDPATSQGKSLWYGGRLFFQPLGPDGMKRVLVCDVDAAARSRGAAQVDTLVPLSRAKPYFNHTVSDNEMRLFETETPQARITEFQDEPIYDPGTNKIEAVRITARLDVNVPGDYILSMKVGGSDGRAERKLNAGAASISVSIPASDLRRAGMDGPFKIDWVELTRKMADGQLLADRSTRNAKTRAYSLAELGSQLYFTGDNSAVLIRGTGSTEDRLEVRIGLYSAFTGCSGSGGIDHAITRGATVSGPGNGALVLSFTGQGIHELRGPLQGGLVGRGYEVKQVSVRCGDNSVHQWAIDVPIQ